MLGTPSATSRPRVLPAEVAQDLPISGCRHSFVRQVLHDPRFAARTMPASPDLMHPDTLDVTRETDLHLARLPGLALAQPLGWLGSVPVRQVGFVPVTWVVSP